MTPKDEHIIRTKAHANDMREDTKRKRLERNLASKILITIATNPELSVETRAELISLTCQHNTATFLNEAPSTPVKRVIAKLLTDLSNDSLMPNEHTLLSIALVTEIATILYIAPAFNQNANLPDEPSYIDCIDALENAVTSIDTRQLDDGRTMALEKIEKLKTILTKYSY